ARELFEQRYGPITEPVPAVPAPSALDEADSWFAMPEPIEDDQPNVPLRDQLREEMKRIFGAVIYERDIQEQLTVRYDEPEFQSAATIWDYANSIGEQLKEEGRFKEAAACFSVAFSKYEE